MLYDTLHPLLGTDKSNPLFEVLFDPQVPDKLLVHFGMRFLESVPRNSFAEKLLTARLFNAGFSRKELSKTFGWDFKTMQRWGDLLKNGNYEDIKRIDDGRGARKKITEERRLYILNLFDYYHAEKGCHLIGYIIGRYFEFYNEPVSGESIRQIIKERKQEQKKQAPESAELEYPVTIYSREVEMREKVSVLSGIAPSPAMVFPIEKLENTCKNHCSPSSEICKKSTDSPISMLSVNKTFPTIDPGFNQILSCHHVGILLTRIFMDFISEDLGGVSAIIRQWLAMILNGCHNIEQGRALNYRALELFVGKQKTSPDKQRAALKETATRPNITRLFSKNIRMVKAENDAAFLLDPHGVPYTGQLKTENLSAAHTKSLNKKLKKLNGKIKRVPLDRDNALNKNSEKQLPIREKIKELDKKLNDTPREVSRIEKLIREEYVKLNFMPKSLMDAVKITARNIIYQLLEIFRPVWNNYRNDLVVLRELITAMGHIEEKETTIMVWLNPTRQFSKKEKTKIAVFCFQISNRINQHYRLDKTVIISLYEL